MPTCTRIKLTAIISQLPPGRLGNRRYSSLGKLRYGNFIIHTAPRTPFVAQLDQAAVPQLAKLPRRRLPSCTSVKLTAIILQLPPGRLGNRRYSSLGKLWHEPRSFGYQCLLRGCIFGIL